MGLIVKPNTFSSGTTALSAEVNANFDTLYNEVNGSLTDANLSGSAAIADTKLAQITTGGKVNVTALTVTSQAQGDILYYNGTNWVRLAAGTDTNILQTQGAGANPQWIAVASAAEVKTGTDAEKPVTSSTVVAHEGVIKGWVVFDGTAGSLSAADSYNVTSLTDNGTGDYTITWATDFATANYCISVIGQEDQNDDGITPSINLTDGLATGSARISTNNTSTTPVDPPLVCVMAIGDQ